MPATPRQLALAALAVAALSLAGNVLLVWRLTRAEARLYDRAGETLERLAREDAVLRYRVRIPQGTPLRLDLPLDEKLRVKLDTRLPIDTKVAVPVRSPFGRYTMSVPIKTTIPIRTDLPLHIRHTVQIRTRTIDELIVPLEVRVRELPIEALREGLTRRSAVPSR